MKCLNFKKKFKDSLLKGRKISTLRMGVKDYRVGETVKVVAGDEEIGFARIESVKLVRWKDIKDEDVIIEGMKRKKDLERELNKIYGKFDGNSLFTQVIFHMIKKKR